MAKKSEDYGLPLLTFATAAQALGITEADFTRWLLEDVKPSPSRWSEWTKGQRPLPERLIRLYLVLKQHHATDYHARMQALREQREQQDREAVERERREAAKTTRASPAKRRATG